MKTGKNLIFAGDFHPACKAGVYAGEAAGAACNVGVGKGDGRKPYESESIAPLVPAGDFVAQPFMRNAL